MHRAGLRRVARATVGGGALPLFCFSASPTLQGPCTPLLLSMRGKACTGAQYGGGSGCSSSGDAAAAKKATHYSKLGMDGFTDVRFNTAADSFLEHIENVVDALEHAEVEEISCNGGVLTLETANHGTYIINKQAPNIQLWLSSPVSGPHHYDMMVMEEADGGKEVVQWLCDHDKHNLQDKLEKELSEILQTPVKL